MDFNFSRRPGTAARRGAQVGGQAATASSAASAIVKAGGFDRAAYGELAELGLAGLYVAEDARRHGHGPGRGHGGDGRTGPRHRAGAAGADADRQRRAGRLCAATPCKAALAAEDRRRRGAGGAGAPGAQGALPPGRLRDAGHAGRRRLDGQRRQEPGARRRPGRRLPGAGAADGKIALFLVERAAQGVTAARLRHAGRQPRRRGDACATRAATLVTQDGLPALEHARGHRHRRHLRRSRGRDGQDHGSSPPNT